MIGRLQSEQIQRNARQQAADAAAAERKEEIRRVREFTCLALPVLLESINLPKHHAVQLRKQGWRDVETMKSAVLEDFVACGLEGFEARRLHNAVKSITDPRRMLSGGRYTKPTPEGKLIDRGGHTDMDDEDSMIRVTNIADLTKAALSGGGAAVSRREAERQLITGTSKFEMGLQNALLGKADEARRRRTVTDTRASQLQASSESRTGSDASGTQQPRACTPGLVREVVASYGWAPGVASVVRSAAHRYAWKFSAAHPPDRVFRQLWSERMLKEGKWPADELRSGRWSGAATAAYTHWLGEQRPSLDNGCEIIQMDQAVAEQGERMVAGLSLATAGRRRRDDGTRPRSDCLLATFALDLAHRTLTEAGRLREVQTIDEALHHCKVDMDEAVAIGKSHLLPFQQLSEQFQRLTARKRALQATAKEVVPAIAGAYAFSLDVDRERHKLERQELAMRAAAIRREKALNEERGSFYQTLCAPAPEPEPMPEPEPEPKLEPESHLFAAEGMRGFTQSRSTLHTPCGGGPGEADRRQVLALLNASFALRETRMRRVLTAWMQRSRALRSATRQLKGILHRMARARLERCFAWWTEIWQAGDKGRLRRNMLAKRTTGQPSAEVLKRRRERQWQKWEKQNQQLEEQRQARKEAEWRAAKRERLLNTQRARTAELGACRQEAAARSASRGEQAGAEWAAQLKQMEETYAATRHIEKRELARLRAREAAQEAAMAAKMSDARRKQEDLEKLVEDTYIWLRVITTPQQIERSKFGLSRQKVESRPSEAAYRQARIEELKSKRILAKKAQRKRDYQTRRKQLHGLLDERAQYRRQLAEEERALQDRLGASSRSREVDWMMGQRQHAALVRAASR